MIRKPFSQVLKETPVDIRREYNRLFAMFYEEQFYDDLNAACSLKDVCAQYFTAVEFRGTCTSLEDFNSVHHYQFKKRPSNFDINYLVSFCEYSYNLLLYVKCVPNIIFSLGSRRHPIDYYIQQVLKVVEAIGYTSNTYNGITDFVPKDAVAISVAETVDSSLSYKTIEYGHHSMKGDLERKKTVLQAFANELEPSEKKLKAINSTFADDLFFLLNNLNIRHNNNDPKCKYYHNLVASMKPNEVERWYDELYQMCLLAFRELEHVERKNNIKQLKKELDEEKSTKKTPH